MFSKGESPVVHVNSISKRNHDQIIKKMHPENEFNRVLNVRWSIVFVL